MTSINVPQSVSYINGVTNPIARERNAYNRSQIHLVTDEDESHLSDSDIDGLSTNRSVLLTNKRLPIQMSEPSENKDDSLMHWLMQQFQQNGLEQDRQSSDLGSNQDRISQGHITILSNGNNYSDQVADTLRNNENEILRTDRWTKSCSKLDKVKTGNGLHYPRMQQTNDANRRRKINNPVDSVNQLLDEINRKAEGLKSGNDRITHELEKANHIIGDLKQTRSAKRYPAERWAHSTTALSQSRYDSGRKAETPIVRLKRLNNTKMITAQSLLTRSAYPDPVCDNMEQSAIQLNEPKSPTVYHLRSDHRFVVDDRLPQPSPPSSWIDASGEKEEIRLRRVPINSKYPATRRYSSAQQAEPIIVREEYRESSLGPLNSEYHHNSNGVNSTTGVTSKLAWLGRAISQLSLVERNGHPRGEAKSGMKRVANGNTESYRRLSPPMNGTKNLSTMIRRQFRRKATTPNPGSSLASSSASLEQSASSNRCLSLMQLNGSQSQAYEEGQQTPVHIPVYSQKDRRPDNSFVRKFSHDRSMDRLNRQDGLVSKERSPNRNKANGLPKVWRKREIDVDSGVSSTETGWRY